MLTAPVDENILLVLRSLLRPAVPGTINICRCRGTFEKAAYGKGSSSRLLALIMRSVVDTVRPVSKQSPNQIFDIRAGQQQLAGGPADRRTDKRGLTEYLNQRRMAV